MTPEYVRPLVQTLSTSDILEAVGPAQGGVVSGSSDPCLTGGC